MGVPIGGVLPATRFMNFPRHTRLHESVQFFRTSVRCWEDGSAYPWAVVLRAILSLNNYLNGIDQPGTNATPNSWQVTGKGATIPDPWPLGDATLARNGASAALFVQAA